MTIDTGGNTIFGGPNVSVCTLTIRGGCDLAEPFPITVPQIEKGSVVVIDSDHPGQLTLSTTAYDTRVAGIVSGANGVNPGIALHQDDVLDDGENVALSGRVYVLADASYGAIKPGDLLTTSDTPGHAMKVLDHSRAEGAILGKAMTGLNDGQRAWCWCWSPSNSPSESRTEPNAFTFLAPDAETWRRAGDAPTPSCLGGRSTLRFCGRGFGGGLVSGAMLPDHGRYRLNSVSFVPTALEFTACL